MSLDFSLYEVDIIKCPHCSKEIETQGTELFSTNITHNLNAMAKEANIYDCLWHGDVFKKAKDIINILQEGLDKMLIDPEHYKEFDSVNGWGTYNNFIPFINSVLNACKEYPEALIRVYR